MKKTISILTLMITSFSIVLCQLNYVEALKECNEKSAEYDFLECQKCMTGADIFDYEGGDDRRG